MTDHLEIFVVNASYRSAKRIMDKYESRGFNIKNEDDLRDFRKINRLASVLKGFGDKRGYELSIKSHELIKSSLELRVVKWQQVIGEKFWNSWEENL